jgi:SAM-dependent methyltransferase
MAADIDFSHVGRSYAWRIPYLPRFFEEVAQEARLDDKSLVLDLACGTGELATGLAPYSGEVLGIDKSQDMLAVRRNLPANVRFLKADLNVEPISIPRPASLVTIGRAIPYLDRNVILPFLDSSTTEDGAVLVCGAGVSVVAPWLRQYRALCARYRKGATEADEFKGRAFFANSQWKETREIRVVGMLRCRPESLLHNALSHSNMKQGILADRERFMRELEQLLAPHRDANGFITYRGTTWGFVYRRGLEPN